MSDETTKERLCLERKDAILRRLAEAKGMIETFGTYPYQDEKWVKQLGDIADEVSGSFYGNFQRGLN